MTIASHQRRWSRRWWDALSGFGATFMLIAASTEALSFAVRAQALPAMGATTLPIYIAGGAAGAIAAWAGRDITAIILLAALFTLERSIRFASQYRAFALTHDLAALEVVLPQLASLIVGTAAMTAFLIIARAHLARPRDVFVAAGSCFVAGALALLPLRISAVGIVPIGGAARTLAVAVLAVMPAVAAALVICRCALTPVRSALLGSLLVILATGGIIAADLNGRPLDDFALAQTAPLLAAVVLAITTAAWSCVLPAVRRTRPS